MTPKHTHTLPLPHPSSPVWKPKSNLLATEYRKYKQHLLHPHRTYSPAFTLFVEDWDARQPSPGPNTTSASSYNKDHGFLKIPTRRHVPRRSDLPSSRMWGKAGRRGIGLASSSSIGSEGDREGDSPAPVPRGMMVVELGDPFPLDRLMEARKGDALRYSAVAERVDEEAENAPAGCRMVELREPVPIGKLVEKEEREMGRNRKKEKKRGREGGRTVRVGMSG